MLSIDVILYSFCFGYINNMENIKITYKKDIKEYESKSKIIVFDLDGCIANSDDFVLTNEQVWSKDKGLFAKYNKQKPTKSNKDLFCEDYLYEYCLDVEPYFGILDLFGTTAKTSNVAIVTARYLRFYAKTIEWLKQSVIDRYNESTWRSLHYKLFFNENKETSLQYKKRVFKELEKQYEISLVVEDHPDIITFLKKKNVNVLVPATGYKNLNGKDRG